MNKCRLITICTSLICFWFSFIPQQSHAVDALAIRYISINAEKAIVQMIDRTNAKFWFELCDLFISSNSARVNVENCEPINDSVLDLSESIINQFNNHFLGVAHSKFKQAAQADDFLDYIGVVAVLGGAYSAGSICHNIAGTVLYWLRVIRVGICAVSVAFAGIGAAITLDFIGPDTAIIVENIIQNGNIQAAEDYETGYNAVRRFNLILESLKEATRTFCPQTNCV